ncbi:MAG: epoxyqueuosine reductase QueH [Candidatus Aadella gelida]|nr:epoxyqueuosine reductase QueH [Candidatus Aadella gelida]
MNILLHICCGVCAASAAEQLLCDGHKVTGFFYDPNIHPVDEYKKRLDAVKKICDIYSVEVIEGPYDRERWFEMVKGVEYEPEGGTRCDICFKMRLEKTYEMLKKKDFDAFTTTLTVGPMKNAVKINEIGYNIGGEKFLPFNFKKKDGFKRAVEIAKEQGLYQQHYCGCIYSKEEMLKREDRGEKLEGRGKKDEGRQ